MAGPDEKPAGSTPNGSRGEALDRALGRASDAPLRPGNRLTLLRNGPETFDEWLEKIGRAEKWIHLELFQFEGDRTGHRFAEAITQKAREGVHVRVLYDWMGSFMVPRSFWRELRHAGVEVRVVNPPTIGSPLRVFDRDHRKFIAVDGLYASTGGVSVADLWLERSAETGLPYRDTSVGIHGPAVADLELAFARVWDLSGTPLPREERPAASEIPVAGEQDVRIIVQEPGKMRVLRTLELLTSAVEETMWIADAYFLSMMTLTGDSCPPHAMGWMSASWCPRQRPTISPPWARSRASATASSWRRG
jgi:cardiolipin synthase A/B